MSDDIKYPPELEAPIEPWQYRSEYGRLILLLANEVAKRLYVEGVAHQRAECIVELEALVRSLRGSKETMVVCGGDQ